MWLQYKLAEWEKNDNYCDQVKSKSIHGVGRMLLDVMDLYTFDFLMCECQQVKWTMIARDKTATLHNRSVRRGKDSSISSWRKNIIDRNWN